MSGFGRSPRARWGIALIAALLAALWLAMMLGGTGLVDQKYYEALYVGGRPALTDGAIAVTQLGSPWVLIPATLAISAWLWWRKHPHTAITLVLVAMVGRGVNSVLKLDVSRPRPTLEPHLVVEHSNSFPSGHAAGSMIFFLTLALLLGHRGPWRRWLAAGAVVGSMVVGMTRVMLGVHWPSDVIGGWAFGALWVLLTLQIAEHLLQPDWEAKPARPKH